MNGYVQELIDSAEELEWTAEDFRRVFYPNHSLLTSSVGDGSVSPRDSRSFQDTPADPIQGFKMVCKPVKNPSAESIIEELNTYSHKGRNN